MKKVLKKVLASAAILSMLGAGSSTMAGMLRRLPALDKNGEPIVYNFTEDYDLVATIHEDGQSRKIRIRNRRDLFEALGYGKGGYVIYSCKFKNLPEANGEGYTLQYSYNNNVLSVTLLDEYYCPSSPKIIGSYQDGIAYFDRAGIRIIFGI